MTVHAIITGALHGAPETRVAKTGRDYVTATLRARDGDELRFINVISFSESAQTELMRTTISRFNAAPCSTKQSSTKRA